MLKIKQAILIALPPLLTVLMLAYAYYRHRNPEGEPTSPPTEEKSYFEDDFAPAKELGTAFEKSPDESAKSMTEAGGEPMIPETAKTKKLTLEEAERRIIELASPLSKLPLWQKILGQSRPLRRFVTALDTVALGKRPLEPLDFLRPEIAFAAEKRGQHWQQSDTSRERFSGAVRLFCGMSPAAIAQLYRFLEPALQEACDGLGYRDKPVQSLLTEACTVLLSTPILEAEPLLTGGGETGVFYWQHPELEALNDAQKLFLRLGNKNVALARKQLENIATELQLYQQ